MIRGTRSRLLLCLLAALLFTALPGAATAQDGALRGFSPIGDYQLRIGGEEVPGARIFALRSPAAILVVTSRFQAPVLLRPQDSAVQTVQVVKIAEQTDGSIDLLPGYLAGEAGAFSVDGVDVRFTVGGVSATLGPKPPLLGLRGLEELRSYSPEYRRREEAYEPSGPILQQLRQRAESVRVRVFFGTWCPACGQMVPRMMRVADELEGSKLEIEFYGLPRGFDGEPEAARYDIHSVPTGVVFVDGKEVGRISGNSWKLPELAITNLLVGS